MTFTALSLYLLLGVALAGGVGMVGLRNPIHAAVSLLTTMLCLAGVYGLLHAHLMAVFQVIIYAGAIMVLIVYIIMLLDLGSDDSRAFRDPVVFLGVPAVSLAVGLGLHLLAGIVRGSQVRGTGWESGLSSAVAAPVDRTFGTVASIGRDLLGPYVLPFEVTSILLLAGIVGAIYLTSRDSAGLRSLDRTAAHDEPGPAAAPAGPRREEAA